MPEYELYWVGIALTHFKFILFNDTNWKRKGAIITKKKGFLKKSKISKFEKKNSLSPPLPIRQ